LEIEVIFFHAQLVLCPKTQVQQRLCALPIGSRPARGIGINPAAAVAISVQRQVYQTPNYRFFG
jgi:hypothetical protein